MSEPLSDAALDQIFKTARSANAWTDETVSEAEIRQIYDLLKMGPTSANSSPARFVWLPKGSEGRKRLLPMMSEGNRAKTEAAPWTVIIAHDQAFYEKMVTLFPTRSSMFDAMKDDHEKRDEHVVRNGTLQSAYLIIAARALGLDCGPMSGFDAKAVNEGFFIGDTERGNWRVNWICNIGHMQDAQFDRLPRLPFDEAGVIL